MFFLWGEKIVQNVDRNFEVKRLLGLAGVDGSIILKRIFMKYYVTIRTASV
jgi:hypothetical protein